MSKAIVRCRCGHQVLAKEVLRTDLYERPTGREYVYVKYRCRRCKRLGEAFVAESRWDWSILEPLRNDMSDAERDLFLDKSPISELELIEFQCELKDVHYISELSRSRNPLTEGSDSKHIGADNPVNSASGRNHEPRSSNVTDEALNSRKRTSSDDRRLHGANEETRSEDSSSTAT